MDIDGFGNGWDWVDVVWGEDACKLRQGITLANLSLIPTIVMNLCRHGYPAIAKAKWAIAHT